MILGEDITLDFMKIGFYVKTEIPVGGKFPYDYHSETDQFLSIPLDLEDLRLIGCDLCASFDERRRHDFRE